MPAKVVPDKRRKLMEQVQDDEPESPLADMMPVHPLMASAWVGSVRYALTRDDVMATFREETGNQWRPGRTPIDAMIDQTTGAALDFIRAFAKWHNENIWGEVDGKPEDITD
ncbi:hypothetical protein [Aquisphaera giovannonii]|nr:hypothetical protein [Aquisphaera giovannonii]